MVMQQLAEAALRAVGTVFYAGVNLVPIGQQRHDQSQRQRRDLRFLAGQQNTLAPLIAYAVTHFSGAALSAIAAFLST